MKQPAQRGLFNKQEPDNVHSDLYDSCKHALEFNNIAS